MSKKSKTDNESESSTKGAVEYFFENTQRSTVNGVRKTREEYIIKGDKGLTIKFFSKEGDKSEKLIIKDNGSNFDVMSTADGKQEDKKTMSKDELLKLVSKDKNLKFIADFLENMKGGSKKRVRRSRKSRKSR